MLTEGVNLNAPKKPPVFLSGNKKCSSKFGIIQDDDANNKYY